VSAARRITRGRSPAPRYASGPHAGISRHAVSIHGAFNTPPDLWFPNRAGRIRVGGGPENGPLVGGGRFSNVWLMLTGARASAPQIGKVCVEEKTAAWPHVERFRRAGTRVCRADGLH